MGAKTSIEWTAGDDGSAGATWNPTRGCSRVSAGCQRCYAESIAARFSGPGKPFAGFAERNERGAHWTGRVELVPSALDLPLRWRKPRRVFVNSMSDLFHEKLSDEAIDRVFAVMLLAPQHIYQCLTKRAERMQRYLTSPGLYARVLRAADDLRADRPVLGSIGIGNPATSPAAWIWLGVSVEDQTTADARIPRLLATPAAVRFVSYEPALAAVDLQAVLDPICECPDGEYVAKQYGHTNDVCPAGGGRLSWVIVGGESGPRARPFDVSWARSAIAQCRAAGVACFVKQLGAWPVTMRDGDLEEGRTGTAGRSDGMPWDLPLLDRKGGDPAEWPEDLRVREMPKTA